MLALIDAVRVGQAEKRDRAVGRGDIRRKAIEILGERILGERRGKIQKATESHGKPQKSKEKTA
jgi:hypothetical protein